MAGFETGTLQELVQQKENEWREAQELQIKSLQSALKEKERQLSNEKVRFRKLKEDFEYNLKLLEERDQELQRYDALFLQVRNINSARDGEVSDLKIQLDELKVKLSHEEKAKEELQRHYQQVSDFRIMHYHKFSIKSPSQKSPLPPIWPPPLFQGKKGNKPSLSVKPPPLPIPNYSSLIND